MRSLLIILSLGLVCLLIGNNPLLAQQIVAHRGASYDAPENTLAAFRLAWEQQADAIEGDFYLTQDNEIVCLHDNSTKRVAPGQPVMQVDRSTLANLRTLDVGNWKDPCYQGERIPTLREVLATVPAGKQIFVEIKCGPEILPILKQQLADSGLAPEQIVIICFNEAVIQGARQLMPQYKANWLTSYKRNLTRSHWRPTREEILKTLQRSGATGLGTQGNMDVIQPAWVQAIHDAGLELHVWTINDVGPAETLASFGADSITTDRPAFIRDAIRGANRGGSVSP